MRGRGNEIKIFQRMHLNLDLFGKKLIEVTIQALQLTSSSHIKNPVKGVKVNGQSSEAYTVNDSPVN